MPVVHVPVSNNTWGSNATTDSIPITIPADAELLVVAIAYWPNPQSNNDPEPSVDLDGNPFTTGAFRNNSNVSQVSWIGYLDVRTLTGPGTLNWSFNATSLAEGAAFVVSAYKNVDFAAIILDSGAIGSGPTNNLSITGLTGTVDDMMIGACNWFDQDVEGELNNQNERGSIIANDDRCVLSDKLWGVTPVGDGIEFETLVSKNHWGSMTAIVVNFAPVGPPTHEGTGVLKADAAKISGTGTVTPPIEGTGVLKADVAKVVGTGVVIRTGTGALKADAAKVVGEGDVLGEVAGTGSLKAQVAKIVGIGERVGPVFGDGVLKAAAAKVVGTGQGFTLLEGAGALQAQPAKVLGSGEGEGISDGVGVLKADAAKIAGAGAIVYTGSGTLKAGVAKIAGFGDRLGDISGAGVLKAQAAKIVSDGFLTRIGAGSLKAGSAKVQGVAFLIDDTTLTAGDLLAIQEVVWTKLVNEGLVDKVNELWQRRGLDPANPHTLDRAGGEIRVGNVVIDVDGDANEVTHTRRP